MYVPIHFKNTNLGEVKDFIHQNGFGILLNQSDNKILATHIPLFLEEKESEWGTLYGHISRANEQWKDFESNQKVLTIFHGPHSYISSSWYVKESVPTWNYVAVHAYGNVKIIEGDELRKSLENLMNKYESHSKTYLKLSDISPQTVNNLLRGIVGFRIEIEEIQAAYKLSQNRDAESYQSIINHLEASSFENEIKMAKILKNNT